MANGIAYQGLAAAVVLTAIDKITKMVGQTDDKLDAKIKASVLNVINNIPTKPESLQAKRSDSQGEVASALASANLDGLGLGKSNLPSLLDQALFTFFDDYTSVLDRLFPGLMSAGQDADAFVRSALQSALGVSYSETVDSAQPETVFLMARKQAFAQERATLDAAAAAGHRFAPGTAINAIARLHADSMQAGAEALMAAHAARVQQERNDKIRLVRAEIGQRMDRVKTLQSKVAEGFRIKMRARGLWLGDQDAVIDAWNGQAAAKAQFDARLDQLLREATARRHASVVAGYEVSDRAVDIGKLRLATGQEVVDVLGNMATTLQNQIRANGSYGGTERDVTNWDDVLRP